MIQCCEDICWVRAADGRSVPFDGARLVRSIRRAAETAGHADWWPGDAVGEAVFLAIQEYFPRQTIGAAELAVVVVKMLTMVGFADIASAYQRRSQYAEIRLDQMTAPASAASAATELGFFQQLDAALRVTARTELASVYVCGLRSCVMQLRGARHWTESCQRLAEDIVSHVRDRVARTRPKAAGALRLAVVE